MAYPYTHNTFSHSFHVLQSRGSMAVGRTPMRNSLWCILTPEPWQEIVREHSGHRSLKGCSSDLTVETTKVWYPGTFVGTVKFTSVGVTNEYF